MSNFLNKHKKLLPIGIIIGITSLLGYISWNMYNNKKLSKDFVSGNGRIEASEIDVATKMGGRLTAILVEEGDLVKKDQILAKMQTDILRAQLDEAQAKYRQAIKTVDTYEAKLSVTEHNLLATKSIAKQRETELNAAQKRLTRSQLLAKSGAISKQVLDDDHAAADTALAALDTAKAQIRASEFSVVAAQADLNGIKSTIDAYLANLRLIETEINDCELKAPCDAKVQYKIVQPGEVLGAGGKVLSLINIHDLHMSFFLPETVVGKLPLGNEVRIVLDAAPDYVIPAKICFISSVAQFTPKTVETINERQKLMFRVKAKIDCELVLQNLDQVKTGVPGEAFIKLNPNTPWPKKLMLRAEMQ